jgi:hypothetical protein
MNRGKFISGDEANRRRDKAHKKGKHHRYLLVVDRTMRLYLDGADFSSQGYAHNDARFVNHTCPGAENLKLVKRLVGGIDQYMLISTKKISAGTTLGFVYGYVLSENQQLCRCDSPYCLKTIAQPLAAPSNNKKKKNTHNKRKHSVVTETILRLYEMVRVYIYVKQSVCTAC